MGSAITSPSTTPVAFVGRPRGPPRCKSAPLYHRAQVARPISQGLQGGETPFCAQLHPVAPGCARLHPLAPACARLHPLAPGCARLRLVVPSSAVPHHPAPSRTVAPGPFRGAAPSHPSPFAPQRHRTPAPSHPGPFALLHRHTPALRTPAPSHPGPSRHFFNRCHCFSRRHLPRKPTLIQPYSLRGNRWKSTTGQSLLTRCFFFSSC